MARFWCNRCFRFILSSASFGRPVLLTLLHMTVCAALLAVVLPTQAVTRQQSIRIAGLAAVFATSVVCGNLGLSLVHVSFFQVPFLLSQLTGINV